MTDHNEPAGTLARQQPGATGAAPGYRADRTLLVRAGVAVDQVGPRGRLEDAFLQLVGGQPT